MNGTYPIELKLTGRKVLVIGGGTVAARKVATLIEAGALVLVVSPDFTSELIQAPCDCISTIYRPELLECAELVFACTGDRKANAAIAADARARKIWCNIADDPAASDFHVPAVLRQGGLSVSVGTGGASPLLAAFVRDRLVSNFGPEFAILVEELSRARQVVQTRVADPEIRRRIFQTLCTECSIQLIATRGRQAWQKWFERVMEYRLKGLPQDPDTE